MRRFACLLACLLAFGASAQEPAPPTPDSAAEAEAEASALYRMGLDLAGKGQYAEACGVFDRITKAHPGSEYAAKAEEQMALAALVERGGACGDAPASAADPSTAAPAPVGPPLTDKQARREWSRGKGDDNGRVELVISQAFAGPLFFGLGVPASAGANATWIYLTGGLVGLGAGIGIPLAISAKYPVTDGQAMLVLSGELMGTWNGFFIAAAIPGLWDDSDAFQLVSAVSTAGFVIGGAAGVAAAVAMKPTGGEISMFRSGFTWGAYFGGVSILLTNGTASTTDTMLRLGLFSDLGAILGAVAATQWPISRSHMNIVNLSGYAGALGLGLIYGIISLAYSETSAPVWGTVLAAGAIGGLTTGAFLSRNMDVPQLAWMGNGSALGLEEGRWMVGMPLPSPRLAPDGSIGVDVRLAAGRW